MLLEDWLNIERSSGQIGDVSLIENRLPKKLKRRREVITEEGTAGYEEYYDYVFPDETASLSLNILEAAYKWKKQKLCQSSIVADPISL
ncbi:Crooked neck-like protein [Thalictrum thalictroides]|uniref:Crooked neck-like protein n=1 Tax=Thalictrum thalictroides TaxID=46969 RepID=A0A7J6WFD0_THATH|nr:Crooked neck-like protein [Thalictrum thalictroides]